MLISHIDTIPLDHDLTNEYKLKFYVQNNVHSKENNKNHTASGDIT